MQEVLMIIMAAAMVIYGLYSAYDLHKLDVSVMGLDYKLEEVLLMLTRLDEQDNPKLVRVGDVINVLSAELDIPISDLVAGMDIVPGVEDLD